VLDVTDECTAQSPRPWQVNILNIRHFERDHNKRIVAVPEDKIGTIDEVLSLQKRTYKLSIPQYLNDPESSESAKALEARPATRKESLDENLGYAGRRT
jgi:hypothetical protein